MRDGSWAEVNSPGDLEPADRIEKLPANFAANKGKRFSEAHIRAWLDVSRAMDHMAPSALVNPNGSKRWRQGFYAAARDGQMRTDEDAWWTDGFRVGEEFISAVFVPEE